jgi:polysaccharide biosynthesis/export protein
MDFNRVLAAEPGSADDIILEDGDVLMVPGPMQSVTVLGEVQSPTSILFDRALARDDYINLSGGMTRRADASRVYIVRANGQVTLTGRASGSAHPTRRCSRATRLSCRRISSG